MLPVIYPGRANQRQAEDRSKKKFVPTRGGHGCPRPAMLLPVRSAGFTFSVILLGLLGLYMCSQLGAIDRKVGRIANALDNLKGTQLTPIAAQAAPGRTEADFSPQVVSKPPLPVSLTGNNRYKYDNRSAPVISPIAHRYG